MKKITALVIEDEQDIAELIGFHLEKEDYKVRKLGSGEKALETAKELKPDFIVLDLMLPGIDGLTICKSLKSDEATKNIPVIMLTAKSEETDMIVGLELGADDYIAKPFSPKVFLARIRAVLRRDKKDEADSKETIKVKNLEINPGRHELLIDGEKIDLTYTEFYVLHSLARRPGWVFTRSQIVDSVRGRDYPVTERSVDVQIVGIRKKLGKYSDYLETVRGVGYRFMDQQ